MFGIAKISIVIYLGIYGFPSLGTFCSICKINIHAFMSRRVDSSFILQVIVTCSCSGFLFHCFGSYKTTRPE